MDQKFEYMLNNCSRDFKKNLIYYLNIILAIYFLMNLWLFASYMIYILIKYYLTNNLNNYNINSNKINKFIKKYI